MYNIVICISGADKLRRNITLFHNTRICDKKTKT